MNKELVATDIVIKVLENLKDRRGFRHLLESIELEDEETFKEILDSLKADIIKLLGDYGI